MSKQAMTSHERIRRMFEHREADRIPVTDTPWWSTIVRWRGEGMPSDAPWEEYFGFDRMITLGGDVSPRYPTKVIEETERYVVSTTPWGATMKNWKHATSVPEFLDFTIRNRDTWGEAKARMKPTPDRVDWDHLAKHYPEWQAKGWWLRGGLCFGFDIFASWVVGTERMLVALHEDPDWATDMFNHSLDVSLALLEMIWDAGYRFDAVYFTDDLGYRNGPFFSPETYRRVLMPAHKRAFNWAHDRGCVTMLHSCGNIMKLLPDLIDAGLDCINPLEAKAGMDLVAVKRRFGDRLVLHGGIDVRRMNDPNEAEDEIRTKITVAKENGGYIYHSDHSVPDSVSFESYQRVLELVRTVGAYEAGPREQRVS